jgi:hypothetical protein
VARTDEEGQDPFSAIEGVALTAYVEVSRALVRAAGDSARRIEEVLQGHGLPPERWDRIRAGWSERIRHDPRVRAEFRRLYAGPSGARRVENE